MSENKHFGGTFIRVCILSPHYMKGLRKAPNVRIRGNEHGLLSIRSIANVTSLVLITLLFNAIVDWRP